MLRRVLRGALFVVIYINLFKIAKKINFPQFFLYSCVFLYLRTSALAFVPHATQPRKSQFPRSYSHPTQPILQSLALFFENTATPLIDR